MKQSSIFVFLLLIAIIACAIAAFASVSALTLKYLRSPVGAGGAKTGIGERVLVSDDLSVTSPARSMAERRQNIEDILQRKEEQSS